MEEQNVNQIDQALIDKFGQEAEKRLSAPNPEELTMFAVASSAGIDLTQLPKEGPMMIALWVALLTVMRKYYKSEDFKYPTLDSFLEQYDGKFAGETEQEVSNLWQTANWMNILFGLIPARKNKGLVMQVIPKLIEGWEAKYVTGSGQTRFTAHRVHIFEVEGNTKANHRGKHRMGGKKRSDANSVSKSIQRNIAAEYKSTRRRKRGPRAGKGVKKSKQDEDTSDEDHDHHMDYTDGDEDDDYDDDEMTNEEVNEEMVHAYSLFRDTSGTGNVNAAMEVEGGDSWGLDLIRSTSILNLGKQGDGSLQREVSWTEIPIAESSQDFSWSPLSPLSIAPSNMFANDTAPSITPVPAGPMYPGNMQPPMQMPGTYWQYSRDGSYPMVFPQYNSCNVGMAMSPQPFADYSSDAIMEQPMVDNIFRGYQVPIMNCTRWQGSVPKL